MSKLQVFFLNIRNERCCLFLCDIFMSTSMSRNIFFNFPAEIFLDPWRPKFYVEPNLGKEFRCATSVNWLGAFSQYSNLPFVGEYLHEDPF